MYTNWRKGRGYRGERYNCIIASYRWTDYDCSPYWTTSWHSSACLANTTLIRRKQSVTFVYKKQDITFPSIHVQHRIHSGDRRQLDSWTNKSMSGFRLRWFLTDENGTKVTKERPARIEDWHIRNSSARFKEDWLVKMAELARQGRLHNLTRNEIVRRVIQKKGITIGFIQQRDMCTGLGGQVKPEHYSKLFGNMSLDLASITSKEHINEEDILTGFMLFSALVYCPESQAELYQVYQFINNLVSKESSKTIINAIVNTIKGGKILEEENKKRVNSFYLVLEKYFSLQFGNILLAISTERAMEDMKNKNWPFIGNHTEDGLQRLKGKNSNKCYHGVGLVVRIE